MPKKQEDLKILYVQIRDDEETQKEEFNEFVRFSGLKPEQFTILNVFKTPNFEESRPEHFDAVFVGGSSDASVMKPLDYPFVGPLKDLLVWCVKYEKPVFASCFGFQAAVDAMGGKLVVDERNIQDANAIINITEEGVGDILLEDTKNGFFAVSFHKERAESLPDGAILLAYSETSPNQAFKLKDKPFYAFQFHPEIDKTDLVARMHRYVDRYHDDAGSSGMLRKIIDTAEETPESNKLLRKFVERVLLI